MAPENAEGGRMNSHPYYYQCQRWYRDERQQADPEDLRSGTWLRSWPSCAPTHGPTHNFAWPPRIPLRIYPANCYLYHLPVMQWPKRESFTQRLNWWWQAHYPAVSPLLESYGFTCQSPLYINTKIPTIYSPSPNRIWPLNVHNLCCLDLIPSAMLRTFQLNRVPLHL